MDKIKALTDSKLLLKGAENPLYLIAGFPLLLLVAYFLSGVLFALVKKQKNKITLNTVFFVLSTAAFIIVKSMGYHNFSAVVTFYFFLGSFIFFILYRLLKKIMALSFILAIAAVIFFFMGFNINHKKSEIALVKVIKAEDGKMQLSLKPLKTEALKVPKLFNLKGERFSFLVYQIIYSDYLFYFGVEASYRLVAIQSYNKNFKQKDTYFFSGTINYKDILDDLQKKEKYLPGIKSIQVSNVMKIAKENDRFKLVIKADGALLLVPQN